MSKPNLFQANDQLSYDSSKIDNGLIYYSSKYRDFLKSILNAESHYLINGEAKSPKVLFPMFVKDGPYGLIANSLPFFGSHGSPVVDGSQEISVLDVLRECEKQVLEKNWSAITIVENPFATIPDSVLRKLKLLRQIDTRMSQVTHAGSDIPFSLEELMKRFHVKMRNAIRKGAASGQEVLTCDSNADWSFLINEHQKSIRLMGGVPKGIDVFDALRAVFGEDLQLHCGFVNGQHVSALLTIRYQNSIEYFIPVTDARYRSAQVLPHLIATVMLSEFQKGMQFWNWGGTWLSQSGVHQFKARFDAISRPYRYIHWSKPELAGCESEVLKEAYGLFYVRKFDV